MHLSESPPNRSGPPGVVLGLLAFFAGLFGAPNALAQEATAATPSDAPPKNLGMDPSAPQAQALPGGTTPRMGEPAGPDWRFDFHGFFVAPLRVGINSREVALPGQSKTVLHVPPTVPDDLETFSHTGVTPIPQAQLNFSYGNDIVTGTASLLAQVPNVSTGFFDPAAQQGIYDLFLTILPKLGERARLTLNVGAFSNRYGVAGEYDEGRYGTPLIARINGVGENVSFAYQFDKLTLMVEQGIMGQSNKANNQLTPDGWNDFGDPRAGSTFAHHFHLGATYNRMLTVGGHYVGAWAQDDRATGSSYPDGRIDIFGLDVRLTLGRFGHFYSAFSSVNADNSRTVGKLIEVLNTRGGKGLMDNYLGPSSAGTGRLFVAGGQYDLSIGRLISYPVPFNGDGPDIYASLFALYTYVNSEDHEAIAADGSINHSGNGQRLWDNVAKLKFGGEATYTFLPWMGASLRYDQVAPDLDRKNRSFSIIAPRLIFHTDWQSRDQVVLQYSRWIYGSDTRVRDGYPAKEDNASPRAVDPDEHMISLSASMWW